MFYNEKSDFNNVDSPVTYKVYYNTETVKSIKVEFYYSEQDPDPFTTVRIVDRHSVTLPDVVALGLV